MLLRWGEYEIDLGELWSRIRGDWRYALAALLAGLALFGVCAWSVLPRATPVATLYLAGPEGITLVTAGRTFGGGGPHRVPATAQRGRVSAPGYYAQELSLELSAGTTATLAPALPVRPAFQEISAVLPDAWIEHVYLAPGGARFQVAVTVTAAVALEGVVPAFSRQWWELGRDGQRERLFQLEAGPAAESPSGARALLRPEGLYLEDGTLLLTDTANVSGLTWWGEEVLLFRTMATGVELEVVPTSLPPATASHLAVLPLLPETHFALSSPGGGYLVLLLGSGGSDSLVVLDRRGQAHYLADLPSSPLPWAYLAWQGEGLLLWAAPQKGPDGQVSWPIRRLDLPRARSELLDVTAEVHGLWLEDGRPYYLDGDARVREVGGEERYRMEEIDPREDFLLWKGGGVAVLYTASARPAVPPTADWGGPEARGPIPSGRYWLLSWPEGAGP